MGYEVQWLVHIVLDAYLTQTLDAGREDESSDVCCVG